MFDNRTHDRVTLRSTLLATLLLLILSPTLAAQQSDTLLAVAVRDGRIEQVRSLLEQGADPNRGFEEFTPLMLAAMNGEIEIARTLLAAGARLDHPDPENGTALCVASFTPIESPDGPAAMVRFLLEKGAATEAGNGADMTPLMYAAREGNLGRVAALVDGGANAAHTDVRGWSPLMFGVRSGNPRIVARLLEAGADPNVPTDFPIRRPLHFAAEVGSIEIVESLLDAGADIDGMHDNREVPPPVALAALKGHDELVRFLVEQGAALNRPFLSYPYDEEEGGPEGAMTLLDVVDHAGQKELAQMIRDREGIGYRELQTLVADVHAMVAEGDLERIDHALRLGIDPSDYIEVGNETTSLLDIGYLSGDTALFGRLLRASRQSYWGHYNLLVRLVTDDATDFMVVTARHVPVSALMVGIETGNDRMIDLAFEFVEKEAILRFGALGAGTPLHLSVAAGDIATLERLLELDLPVDIRDEQGGTPLQAAVWNDNLLMTDRLLERGADPEARDRAGHTAVMTAVRDASAEVLARLLEAGGSVGMADRRSGETPLHAAVDRGDVEFVRLLLERGAEAEREDYAGVTPVEMAENGGNREILALLRQETD